MNELELLKWLVGALGTTGSGLVVLGYLIFKDKKTDSGDRKLLISTIKENAVALTKLTVVIEEFNRINGQNQKDCLIIRQSLSEEITKVKGLASQIGKF